MNVRYDASGDSAGRSLDRSREQDAFDEDHFANDQFDGDDLDRDSAAWLDRGDAAWVSPYLRRRLRSLEEVLAERRARELCSPRRGPQWSKNTVIRLGGSVKHYGRVA